ncbi:hypothetical protein HYX04_05555 [Candidatus Woesearchaeota archaeon]|nr:hypothetical protein [Candidatus Woesearchaeota archaeon]
MANTTPAIKASTIKYDKPYDGLFNGLEGFRYIIILQKRGRDITDVIVMPSEDSKIPFIPERVKPEISNYIYRTWDYKKEPRYVSPMMN